LCPTTWSTKPSNPAYDRPPDLELFANEIEKLSLAAHPDAISRSLIAEMSVVNQPDRLFPLIDAVIAGEGARALSELKTAIARGDELPRITAQLVQQTELMAVLEQAGRIDSIESGRAIGLSNPARMINVGKAMRSLRTSPARLVAEATETERKFKSGVLRQPADQLYVLIEQFLASGRQTRQGGT
jgi:DNA polymerase III delta subunit